MQGWGPWQGLCYELGIIHFDNELVIEYYCILVIINH